MTELATRAPEKIIPFSLNNKLFVIADRYWRIDICPNLKCKLEIPKIIFSSLSIFI